MDPAATLSAAGLVAAAGTVATGVTDWTVSDGEDRRVGLFHGLLNTAAVALQAASLAARLTGHRRPAQALGATGMAVTAPPASSAGTWCRAGRSWSTGWPRAPVPAAGSARSPTPTSGTAARSGVDVEGRKVLLHRAGGRLYAVDDVCSHAGALLSRGQVDGCVVTCPLHGSRFDLPGRAHRARAGPPSPAGAAGAGPATVGSRCAAPSLGRGPPEAEERPWRGKQ
jgi:hypothetical protein